MGTEKNNIDILKAFINQSDPKQIALVGIHALTALAGGMTGREFSAFLHDASAVAEQAHVRSVQSRNPQAQRAAGGQAARLVRRAKASTLTV